MHYNKSDIPVISPFKKVMFPDYRLDFLSNGIPVYSLQNDDYGVMKMEVNVFAGRYFESQQAVSRTCANMLREGTSSMTSKEIARKIDFYGSSLQMMGGMDVIKMELYSLKKHFENVLPIAAEVLRDPLFPENELDNYIKRTLQKLKIDLSKNDIISFRHLTENLFGLDHPYGYNTEEAILQKVSREDLMQHFQRNFNAESFSVIMAGGIPENYLEILDTAFGTIPKAGIIIPNHPHPLNGQLIKSQIKGKQKYQSSVKLGARMFNRSHPDYVGFYFLSTLLGGYFGSRLMQNIREDKGLTYDIYSTVDCMRTDGYFMISADVDNKSVESTLEEIRKELKMLAEELVEQEELELVRNYIKGNVLTILNGPINAVELIRLISIYHLDETFFDHFMLGIDRIDSESLNQLAAKYLNYDQLSQVICGKDPG
jgi:zinc protease